MVRRMWYKVKNGRKTHLSLIQSPVTNERGKAIAFVLYRELLCWYSAFINQLEKKKSVECYKIPGPTSQHQTEKSGHTVEGKQLL